MTPVTQPAVFRVMLEPVSTLASALPSSLTLASHDFMTEGGEAKIYAKNGFVYKLFHDPARTTPVGKVKELAVLDHPAVVRPLGMIKTPDGAVCGVFMQQVKSSLPLARLFSNTFRSQHGVTPEMTVALVDHLREAIQFVHDHGCLIVDGNELNYLVNEGTFVDPYLIDVSCYQTPHYPATAITPSIQDQQTKGFSPLTDWFSFGVVACQLFIGIHPYKGSHPKYAGHDVIARMKAGASIFDRGVKLPPATRNFAVIPDSYRRWFEELFLANKRIPPPTPASTVIADVMIQKGARPSLYQSATVVLPDGRSIAVEIRGQQLVFDGAAVTVHADKIFVVGNRIYALRSERFMEIRLHVFNGRVMPSIVRTWNVLPNATVMLDGLLYQNVLGKPYLVVPVRQGEGWIFSVAELIGSRVVDGKHVNGVVELICAKGGRYDRIQLTLKEGGTYTIQTQRDVDY